MTRRRRAGALIGIATCSLAAAPPRERSDWALLIGVDQYEDAGIADLAYAGDDARALAAALVGAGWDPAHVVIMTPDAADLDLRPTRAHILAEIAVLRRQVGEKDSLFVGFSGHGIAVDDDEARHDYVLPMDAQLVAPEDTAIELDALLERLDRVPSIRRMVVFDACRNVLLAGAKAVERVVPPWDRPTSERAAGTRVLYASTFGNVSFEAPEDRLGALTSALVRGLSGEADGISGTPDGVVDADELYRFSRERLDERCRQTRQCQEPEQGGHWTGDVFPVARLPSPRPRPPAAPRPPPPSTSATSATSAPATSPAPSPSPARAPSPSASARPVAGSPPATAPAPSPPPRVTHGAPPADPVGTPPLISVMHVSALADRARASVVLAPALPCMPRDERGAPGADLELGVSACSDSEPRGEGEQASVLGRVAATARQEGEVGWVAGTLLATPGVGVPTGAARLPGAEAGLAAGASTIVQPEAVGPHVEVGAENHTDLGRFFQPDAALPAPSPVGVLFQEHVDLWARLAAPRFGVGVGVEGHLHTLPGAAIGDEVVAGDHLWHARLGPRFRVTADVSRGLRAVALGGADVGSWIGQPTGDPETPDLVDTGGYFARGGLEVTAGPIGLVLLGGYLDPTCAAAFAASECTWPWPADNVLIEAEARLSLGTSTVEAGFSRDTVPTWTGTQATTHRGQLTYTLELDAARLRAEVDGGTVLYRRFVSSVGDEDLGGTLTGELDLSRRWTLRADAGARWAYDMLGDHPLAWRQLSAGASAALRW